MSDKIHQYPEFLDISDDELLQASQLVEQLHDSDDDLLVEASQRYESSAAENRAFESSTCASSTSKENFSAECDLVALI